MPDLLTASHSESITRHPVTEVRPGRLEKALIVLLLLLFSQALLGRLFASPDNPEGSPLLRMMWLPVYGFTFVMIGLRWRPIASICMRNPFLVLLSVLALCSALWSLDPSTSFRRGIAAIGTTAFGFYLAASLGWKDLLRCLGITWLILGIGNLIAGFLTPGFGVMHEIHVGAWKGLWFEKNAMGGHFARTAFLFAFLVIVDQRFRNLWTVSFFISVGLVLLSTSKTSLLGLLLGLAILGAWQWMKENRFVALASLWLIFTLIIGGVLLLFLMPEAVASLIGRDLTLTGRTQIWDVLARVMEERPVLGFGYGAFWGEDSPPAQLVRAETEWEVPTAHNGLLEVMLALGQLGVMVFILDYAINLVRSLLTTHKRKTSVYAFGFFVTFALFSVSESVILIQNSILWVTYCAIAGRLSLDGVGQKAVRARRSTALSGPRLKPTHAMRGRLS